MRKYFNVTGFGTDRADALKELEKNVTEFTSAAHWYKFIGGVNLTMDKRGVWWLAVQSIQYGPPQDSPIS